MGTTSWHPSQDSSVPTAPLPQRPTTQEQAAGNAQWGFRGLTLRAKAGTGSQEGRPRDLPRAEHSSPMRTGLGAVALKLPLKAGLVMASTYKLTRSSLPPVLWT